MFLIANKANYRLKYNISEQKFIDWTSFDSVFALIKILAPLKAKNAIVFIDGIKITDLFYHDDYSYINLKILASQLVGDRLLPIGTVNEIKILWKNSFGDIILAETISFSVENYIDAIENHLTLIMQKMHEVEEILSLEKTIMPTVVYLKDVLSTGLVQNFKDFIASSLKQSLKSKLSDDAERIIKE